MSPLRNALAEYLTIRRSLGYPLYSQELLLNDFLAFLQQAGADRITIELAVRWARQPKDAKPIWWARRLGRSADSHDIWRRLTRGLRFRRGICCPLARNGWPRISTRWPRLRR